VCVCMCWCMYLNIHTYIYMCLCVYICMCMCVVATFQSIMKWALLQTYRQIDRQTDRQTGRRSSQTRGPRTGKTLYGCVCLHTYRHANTWPADFKNHIHIHTHTHTHIQTKFANTWSADRKKLGKKATKEMLNQAFRDRVLKFYPCECMHTCIYVCIYVCMI
jgi:hypothetical protein